jgi:hypothetical protein
MLARTLVGGHTSRSAPQQHGSHGVILGCQKHGHGRRPTRVAPECPATLRSSSATKNPRHPVCSLAMHHLPRRPLLAREVIQNSWDAAQELVDSNTQFAIEFRFQSLVGEAKQALVDALGLESLAQRSAVIDRAKVGLSPEDCLVTIGEADKPLKVLRITESAASGMYGPWDQNRSHMYLALLSIGFTEKLSGAGGSYGYGKAGLINGSLIRSVVAYSCFRERNDELGITRRLLGVTYWGAHDYEGSNHPGIATFSGGEAGKIQPFVNEEADTIAQELGLPLRTPVNSDDLGTTFVLIDTPIEPQQLVRAIERSWWPALHEQKFTAKVVDFHGSELVPRPMQDPVLHTFIDAWEIAKGRSEPGPEDRRTLIPGSNALGIESVGMLGLVANLSGWSYEQAASGGGEEAATQRSLVALTRRPMMVVEYLEAGQTPPFVRGVFIADDAVDETMQLMRPCGRRSRRRMTRGERRPNPENWIAKPLRSRSTCSRRSGRR